MVERVKKNLRILAVQHERERRKKKGERHRQHEG
jgi:hypothetical protein